MQELVGRLTSLDPDATQTVKVIAYFDALVASGAGVESLVRGAAILTGAASGVQQGGRITRVDGTGRRTTAVDDDGHTWPSVTGNDGTRVWIEREGAAHANDTMVLERLALAVAIAAPAHDASPSSSIAAILTPNLSPQQRAAVQERLRLDPHHPARVWAVAPYTAIGAASATIPTRHGLVQAVLTTAATELAAPRSGTALAATPELLPAAWHDAQLALRLVDSRHPRIDADELGAMMLLARTFDPEAAPHPDVAALRAFDPRARAILDELVAAESIRQAATRLAMHHSSLQSRHRSLSQQLGYDPLTAAGRARYEAARLLATLSASAVD